MSATHLPQRSRRSGLHHVEPIRLEPGASPIPGYKLKSSRGQGSFGVVWHAEGPDSDFLALKFVPSRRGTQVVRELRNLQMLRDFDHPHLLRVRNVWCHSGYIIIGMDLADGSLLDLLNVSLEEYGSAFDARSTCFWLDQAASALDYLNGLGPTRPPGGKGFQHCDIKPSNLLVTGHTLKVADFGISKSMSTGDLNRPSGGTLAYCGPELFEGRVSIHSDQFALAVTYYQLRTGRLPFDDNQYESCSESRHNPDLSLLPVHERSIVKRAIDPHPERRWLTCREFMVNVKRANELALNPL